METNKNNSFCPFFAAKKGVEDVFNALKPEMQQITSREEVGFGFKTVFPGVFGGVVKAGCPGYRLNKGPISKRGVTVL